MVECVINWAMGKEEGDFLFKEEIPDLYCLYEASTGERNPILLEWEEVGYVVEVLESIGYSVWF